MCKEFKVGRERERERESKQKKLPCLEDGKISKERKRKEKEGQGWFL